MTLTRAELALLDSPLPIHGAPPYVVLAPVEHGMEWGHRRHYPYLSGRYPTADAALGALQKLQPHSAAMALHLQGWDVVSVPADRWSPTEEAVLHARSRHLFRDHDHAPSDRSEMTRENCQACCLGGWQPHDTSHRDGRNVTVDGPNVANWQRDYVQAGRPIPRRWALPFLAGWAEALREGPAQNLGWATGLRLDVATYGIVWADR